MSAQNEANYISINTANGDAPTKGPRVMALNLDFSLKSSYGVNLDHAHENDRIEFVQGAFVDNTANSAPLTILNRRTQQQVTFPAYSFGYLALFCPNPPHFHIATTTTGIVNVVFTTFPLANFIQIVGAGGGGIPASGSIGTDASVSKPALLGQLLSTLAVNPARQYFEYQNQSANLHQVVMDDGAGNNLSIQLIGAAGAGSPGGSYTNNVERGRVRVFSSAALDQMFLRQN